MDTTALFIDKDPTEDYESLFDVKKEQQSSSGKTPGQLEKRRERERSKEWRAVYQVIHKGVERVEWEKLYYKYVDRGRAVNVTHPSRYHRAKTCGK